MSPAAPIPTHPPGRGRCGPVGRAELAAGPAGGGRSRAGGRGQPSPGGGTGRPGAAPGYFSFVAAVTRGRLFLRAGQLLPFPRGGPGRGWRCPARVPGPRAAGGAWPGPAQGVRAGGGGPGEKLPPPGGDGGAGPAGNLLRAAGPERRASPHGPARRRRRARPPPGSGQVNRPTW